MRPFMVKFNEGKKIGLWLDIQTERLVEHRTMKFRIASVYGLPYQATHFNFKRSFPLPSTLLLGKKIEALVLQSTS